MKKMTKTLELDVEQAWKKALKSWRHPSIPDVITVRTSEEAKSLGEVGAHLRDELAFMKFPEFQTYANLETIASTFRKNPQRGLNAVLDHEQGHRFCPYDTITLIILNHVVKKALQEGLPYNTASAAATIVNLYTDTCINTHRVREGNKDIPWAYRRLSRDKKDNNLWKVYGRSMELAWKKGILLRGTKLTEDEEAAAKQLALLFNKDVMDRQSWKLKITEYARIISKFLEDEKKDKQASLGNVSGNTPAHIDDKTAEELAKRLAELGSDGLPTNPSGVEDFKDIMAGFGRGNPIDASISFYEMLSRGYDVVFTEKPFGKPRTNPHQPEKWQPSMGAESLDVPYSIQVSGGRLIPGVNTYAWKNRRRHIHAGNEEVIPDLEILIDSSESMPNPVKTISLPVLAGFVAARKAHKKGSRVKVTNFSGNGQFETCPWTTNLDNAYRTLAKYFNGGTMFPHKTITEEGDPKQVLVITDTFVFNKEETSKAISDFLARNPGNRVSVYAIRSAVDSDYLRRAGAEVIHGTTTEIFREVIGRADRTYSK